MNIKEFETTKYHNGMECFWRDGRYTVWDVNFDNGLIEIGTKGGGGLLWVEYEGVRLAQEGRHSGKG